tara:strand:- start:143 stop:529 length:387 start_codon:yes stop_codon:yes gene_type:complete
MIYTDTNQPRFDVEQPSQFWRVQSSTALLPTGSGKWKYTVISVEPRVATDPEDLTWDDVAQTGFINAINLYEQGNTTTSHMGIDPETLPGNFELQPIPADAIVPGTYVSAQDADFIVLLWPNQFSGAC